MRGGYFKEHKKKGTRKMFTLGAGFALQVCRLDAEDVRAVAQTSPLDQTLRFSLAFDMDGIQSMLGRNGRGRRR